MTNNKALKEFGPKITMKDKTILSDINLRELLNLYDSLCVKKETQGIEGYNEAKLKDFHAQDRTSFSGGTPEDLFKTPDMRQFKEAQKRLRNGVLAQKLNETMGQKTRKKRRRCDSDGEFDFDKRYDLKPFMRKQKTLVPNKVIEVEVECSFACTVGSQKITDFGNNCAAIVSLLEARGYAVGITLRGTFTRLHDGDQSRKTTQVRTRIKKSSEYMPTTSIVRTFTSNFYRRVTFAHMVATSAVLNCQTTVSLGITVGFSEPIKIEPQKIIFQNIDCFANESKAAEAIAEAIGKTKQSA